MESEAFNGVCAARLDRDQLAELARLTRQGIASFQGREAALGRSAGSRHDAKTPTDLVPGLTADADRDDEPCRRQKREGHERRNR